MGIHPFSSAIRSAQTLEMDSLPDWVYTYSCQQSNLLKFWRWTHCLDGCSTFLFSGSDLLKHWRETHILDGSTTILISDSDLLKHWEGTHCLDGVSPVLIRGSNQLNHWRATYLLDIFSIYLISSYHSIVLQSYQFVLKKKNIRFSLIFTMNATYILPKFH